MNAQLMQPAKAKSFKSIVLTVLALGVFSMCNGQLKNSAMDIKNSNPLLCDIVTGICELPGSNKGEQVNAAKAVQKPVKVIYYTDPICSSCWGIEPQLRKLKLEYGDVIDIEYRMGGLLPDWSYNSGGISQPSDVAHHWDEVSTHYDMPIDGDVWLEDPLPSSYPPSIAFKAAQMQDEHKAIVFMREIREMVFLQKKNITKWEHIAKAATHAGLNAELLRTDIDGKAQQLFNEDLELGRKLGVRGFPTMFFTDASGKQELVYGSKPYEAYETAILKLHPQGKKQRFEKEWAHLFAIYPTLTAREYAELSGTPRTNADKVLQQLTNEGQLEILQTKNGSLWRVKNRERHRQAAD